MPDAVDAVIPAYNEAATVGAVAAVVRGCGLVRRVIVVSDGSTDGTDEVARSHADVVAALGRNRGKGEALRLGASLSDAPILLFLDADLKGLDASHVRRLIEPVAGGEVDMNVGVIGRGRVYTWLVMRLPKISGQRAIRRTVLEAARGSDLSGFGAEIAMNSACRRIGCRAAAFVLHDLDFVRKYQKVGWKRALIGYPRMFLQVARAMASGFLGHR
jgi:glycosyltransferase involved in cell wall biosynthesis